MPTKTRAKKKLKKVRARKVKRVKAKKKTVRKVAKRVTKKLVRKVMAKKQAVLGTVVHYYDRIGVAVLDLKSPVRLGQIVKFKRGTNEHTQAITSMQVDHKPLDKAGKGMSIGMKVDKELQRGTHMLPA